MFVEEGMRSRVGIVRGISAAVVVMFKMGWVCFQPVCTTCATL